MTKVIFKCVLTVPFLRNIANVKPSKVTDHVLFREHPRPVQVTLLFPDTPPPLFSLSSLPDNRDSSKCTMLSSQSLVKHSFAAESNLGSLTRRLGVRGETERPRPRTRAKDLEARSLAPAQRKLVGSSELPLPYRPSASSLASSSPSSCPTRAVSSPTGCSRPVYD